jgi:hypothetical protein
MVKVLEKLMNIKLIFHGINIYALEEMNDLGLTYFSRGRAAFNVPSKKTPLEG